MSLSPNRQNGLGFRGGVQGLGFWGLGFGYLDVLCSGLRGPNTSHRLKCKLAARFCHCEV